MKNCIFCKIANREMEKGFTYEDSDIMVFPDIHPVRSVHLLIMPKKHIPEFLALADKDLLGKIMEIMQKMIKKKGLEFKGYRVIINGGGAQLIDHFHVHLIGPMGKQI